MHIINGAAFLYIRLYKMTRTSISFGDIRSRLFSAAHQTAYRYTSEDICTATTVRFLARFSALLTRLHARALLHNAIFFLTQLR